MNKLNREGNGCSNICINQNPPTLIADGTKAAYIQEIIGSGTRFTQSDTSPIPKLKLL